MRPRCGPPGREKKYVLGAFTEQYSLLFLGARTLESFRDFGVLPDFAGIAVTDRYVNYFHDRWQHLAGHQACLARLIRDFQDAAETYPDAIAQAQRACGLIKAWHLARDFQPGPFIPAVAADPLITEFRRAVTVGLSAVPAHPRPKHSTAQHPGRDLLEFCRDREDDVLGSPQTPIWPTNNISERGVRPADAAEETGRLTSEQTTQDRLDIRSYIDTARKHGHDVLTVLRSLFTGNPWRPAPRPRPARHNQTAIPATDPAITVRTRGNCLSSRRSSAKGNASNLRHDSLRQFSSSCSLGRTVVAAVTSQNEERQSVSSPFARWHVRNWTSTTSLRDARHALSPFGSRWR